jgi:hypothetical protein
LVGALELWLGIFLPAFVYALLLVTLLIPAPEFADRALELFFPSSIAEGCR